MGYQDIVDASQFSIDLQTQVGQGLRGRLHYVFHLHTLRGHAEKSVTHSLHLSWRQTHREDDPADIHNMSLKANSKHLTIDWRFPWQDDYNQLKPNV